MTELKILFRLLGTSDREGVFWTIFISTFIFMALVIT